MNGLGNDFAVFDLRGGQMPKTFTQSFLRHVADRRLGVGCDQVIVLDEPRSGGDVHMRIFNPDGSEAEACGNATRCVASVLAQDAATPEITIETVVGLLPSTLHADGRVTVDMGAPRFAWDQIPLSDNQDTKALDITIGPIEDPVLDNPCAVNMGNPHCVFFVKDAEALDLPRFGPVLEHHPLFPERTNVGIAQVREPNDIRLRIWERGAGITPACGSGACATAVAAARRGLAERRVTIELDGGFLDIDWREDDHVMLTGPVATAFAGELDASLTALLSVEAGS